MGNRVELGARRRNRRHTARLLSSLDSPASTANDREGSCGNGGHLLPQPLSQRRADIGPLDRELDDRLQVTEWLAGVVTDSSIDNAVYRGALLQEQGHRVGELDL